MIALVRPALLLLALTTAACMSGSPPDGDDFSDPGDDGDDSTGDDGDDGDDGDPVECGTDIIPAPTGPGCAAATQTCFEACEDDACWDGCLAADPNGEVCGTCLEDGYLACANQMGCQTQWDAVACCYEGCADPDSAACETSCTSQSAAYDTCIEAHDEACAASTDAVCFGA